MSALLKAAVLCITGAAFLAGCNSTPVQAVVAGQQVDVYKVTAEGAGEKIGTVALKDSLFGLSIKTDLSQLPPGPHGFHIHEKGSCDPAEKDGKAVAALAAGGHFNPEQVPAHGNVLKGHLGDLPVLNVDAAGNARVHLAAPRLKLADIKGLAIMIHAGGDNYSDHPAPLGGGGARIACGLIP